MPLRGIGTSLVESLTTYTIRMGYVSGFPLALIFRQVKRMIGRNASLAPDEPAFDATVRALEVLCGSENLACGTFRWVANVVQLKSLTCHTGQRRWCPLCYLHWNEDSWEPLYWSMDLVRRCPQHNCALESACHACGAPQRITTPYHRRQKCIKCQQLLGYSATDISPSYYQEWVERQVLDLVELCATPGQPRPSQTAYHDYVTGLAQIARDMWSAPPGLLDALRLRTANARSARRVRLRSLINLCSPQAVSLRQVLLDPRGSASRPLLDLWESFASLPLSYGAQYKKAHAFDVALGKLLRRSQGRCLPAMREVLHVVELTSEQAKDLKPDTYLRYQAAYAAQGNPNQQTRTRRALRAAMRLLATQELLGKTGRPKTLGYVEAISCDARVPQEAAQVALETARDVRRILREAQLLLIRANPPALEDPAWIKGLSNGPSSAAQQSTSQGST